MDCDDWLDDSILLPEQIARKLEMTPRGGRCKRVEALERLADELGFSRNRLACAAYEILGELLDALGGKLERDPKGNLIEDIDSGKLYALIDEVVNRVYLDDVVSGMIQLGRGSRQFPSRPDYRDADRVARDGLATELKQHVVRMLTRWYGTGTWTERHEHRRSA